MMSSRATYAAAIAGLCALAVALVAINERAMHSPTALMQPRRFQPTTQRLPDAGGMGTNKAFLHKGDGAHQSTKAPMTMLAAGKGPGYVPLPEAGEVGTNKAFIGMGDGSGQSTKAKVQMLAQQLNYVPLPNAGGMGTNKAFVGKGDGSGQSTKAPTTMLAQQLNYVPLPRAGGMGTNKAFLNKGDGSGQSTKGKVQMLAQQLNYVPLPNAGGMGTNKAFVGKGDGSGQSTKGKVQMLAQRLNYIPLPDAGGMGTNKAFVGKGDGSGQSTKAPTQKLYDWTAGMEGTYLPADPVLTGENSGYKMANDIGPAFARWMSTPNNLGGIWTSGGVEQPANVLPWESEWVPGTGKPARASRQQGLRQSMLKQTSNTKKATMQSLYDWTAGMEGTYLPADPVLTGENSGYKMANDIGPAFARWMSTPNNLGGIWTSGGVEQPANVLPWESEWVPGTGKP